jgi:nucleotide-binding universal stress UspA family protein
MKVMLTTDGSAQSHHAIREAMRLLPLKSAEVALLAVTPPPLAGMDPIVGFGVADGLAESMQLEQETQRTHQHMDEARRLLTEAGITPVEMEREGDPATAILDAAGVYQPDVLVLGAHKRGPVERLFVGSVSDAVAHRWHGAVLVVRSPD